MDRLPVRSGRGLTVAVFLTLALVLLVYAPSVAIWLIMVAIVGVALYIVYVVGRGTHERALDGMRGDRK